MPDYSHGELLVPFVVLWIIARSARLPPPSAKTSPLAFATLLSTLAIWLVAYQASSAIGEQLTIPVALWSAVWAAFGLPIAARLAVPLACLYFAIPVWEFLVPVLQASAVRASETALGWLGVPVHVDGVLVSIPEGTFKIAQGCAGKRYFLVCITVAALLAGTKRMRPLRAATFLGLSGMLAVLMNWIRVVTVIYAGHITNMTSYLVAVEHISFGWALFAILMVIVCLIGSRFARAGTLRSVTAEQRPGLAGLREMLIRAALPATILVLLIPVLGMAYSRNAQTYDSASDRYAALALSLPGSNGSWTGPLAPDDGWRPRFPNAAAVRRASYHAIPGQVEVFLAQYGRELPGTELVSSVNALYPPEWMVVHRGVLGSAAHHEASRRARLLHLETPLGERWAISYLYDVDGYMTRNDVAAQVAYGVLAWKGSIRSRIAAVASRCQPSCDAADSRLEDFWKTIGSGLLGRP